MYKLKCIEPKGNLRQGKIYSSKKLVNDLFLVEDNWYSKSRFKSLETNAVEGKAMIKASCHVCGNTIIIDCFKRRIETKCETCHAKNIIYTRS